MVPAVTSIRTDFNGLDIETQNDVPLYKVTSGGHKIFIESSGGGSG